MQRVIWAEDEFRIRVKADGVLYELNYAEGDTVVSGQVLAAMDYRIAKAAVQLAEAVAQRTEDVTKAEHDVKYARRMLERFKLAYKDNAVSELELERAGKEARSAQILLDQARRQRAEALLQLELERARLEAHNIRAPFDGQVVEIVAKVGQSLRRSDPVLTIVDMGSLRVELHGFPTRP